MHTHPHSHTYMHCCIHTYMHTHKHTHAYRPTCIHTSIHAYIDTHTQSRTHTGYLAATAVISSSMQTEGRKYGWKEGDSVSQYALSVGKGVRMGFNIDS